MPLDLEITRAWESTNATGGALASALHALNGNRVDIPDDLRRASAPRTQQDNTGEALLLLEEAKRANQRAAGQIQLALDEAAKQLATR